MSQIQTEQRKKTVSIQKRERKCSVKFINPFDRKYNAAVKAYFNYMERLHLILKEKETKIFKILHDRTSPLWFQELTDKQCTLCDQLLDAIIDDTDERTFHRTQEILKNLGVYPSCPRRVLRTALILCNRNDISFVWILLELHFIRRPAKEVAGREKDYSINERLLLSAIAHLDMMTTLRGLEKVLPPKKKSLDLKPEDRTNRPKTLSKCPKSPYMNRQKVLVTGYTVPIQVQPHRDDFLGRYEKYRDPEFIIRNEESRWFSKRNGSQRNLFSSEYYFYSEEPEDTTSTTSVKSSTSASIVVKALLDDHIRNMITQIECCELLCPKHHEVDSQGMKLLQILKRDTPAQSVLMQAVRAQCAQWTEEELRADSKRQVESLLKRLINEAVTMAVIEPASECPECLKRFDMQKKLLKGQKCTCVETDSLDTLVTESMTNLNKRYFRFCDKSVAFEFDYDKILDNDTRREPSCPIKGAIQRALGVEQTESRADVDRAIEKFTKMTWDQEIKHWNDQMAQDNKKDTTCENTDPLEVDYIDTKDLSVLQNLLKRALRKLAEQPMYLLATFPDVDKLPILIAWIRKRYDVPVCAPERGMSLLESKHFWNCLIPYATHMRWPTRKDTGLQEAVTWDYKTRLESMTDKLMYKFYRKFKNVQIQEGRLLWTSMVPYHAGADRFRRTFSAYFPNCEPDVLPLVHPWRSFEYRSMTKL
ncbi:uncharacterized protein LOC128721294 [Anopheles nili]|uniref:uncharacterized protein LOC128721294 n=1 Tax=Anopheles nili TaxID=185578 RepID=UPI00237BDE5E|nr:uncharacterized protein LOC128721294 [Anopheles nili]